MKLSISSGWGLAMGVAAGLSWYLNHSVLWLMVHAVMGWVYVGFKAGPALARFLGL